MMDVSVLTDRIILQGRALVRAIEALGTIQPSGSFEQAVTRLLEAAYKRRLRAVVAAAPAWASEETEEAVVHRNGRALSRFVLTAH